MRRRGRAWIAPLVGVLLCAALLTPRADRDALVALAIGHQLREDLNQTFAADGTAPDTLFGALDRLLTDSSDPSIAATVELDGVEVRRPDLERALAAQLNRFSEQRGGSGRVLLAPRGEASVDLLLHASSVNDRISIGATLSAAGAVTEIPRGLDRPLPGRSALLPPLLAISVALLLRRVLLALFVGIYAGAVLAILNRGVGVAEAALLGLWEIPAVYLRAELLDTFRVEIIGFVVALIALIGVISRAGGVQGLVERLMRFARTVRSALTLTWVMGLLIFFDDYANCMLVGSTMRPLTDRLRISREKLAYIVDSTAAPIAGISLLSTWIAFEVSVFSAQLPEVGISESGYTMFLRALPFRYYCFLTLIFVGWTILSGRDFGPMARAERRARRDGLLVRSGGRAAMSDRLSALQPAPGMTRDWRLAAAPIGLTLLVALARIFIDGGGLGLLRSEPASLLTLVGISEVATRGGGAAPIFSGACAGWMLAVVLAGSFAVRTGVVAGFVTAAGAALLGDPLAAELSPRLGASLAGYLSFALVFALVAGAVTWLASRWARPSSRPHLSGRDLRQASFSAMDAMGFAVVLLFEAWILGAVCRDVFTGEYLVALLSGSLPPEWLPILLFVIACAVSFATGSSWSTMSIMLPNVVALAASLGAQTPLGTLGMVAISIAAVLDGSIFGDHCSPISDTTVLSSIASGSDHVDHVRTQAPYALAAAALALCCGYLPSVLLTWWSLPLALGSGALLIGALLLGVGRSLSAEPSG